MMSGRSLEKINDSRMDTSIWLVISLSIQKLHPAYFALVMATGIVSIAAHYHGLHFFATSLFLFNIFAYLLLWTMLICRLLFYSESVLADVMSHKLSPGFFTIAAGTGVLGAQFLLIGNNFYGALVFWILTIGLWVLLTYLIFTVLIVKEEKPQISEGINGSWLIAIVATQSVTVLTNLIAPHFEEIKSDLLLFSFITWLFGGMLYIWIISLIFYRYTFFKFQPEDLSPPYWINMGAVAISTLGGTGLIASAPSTPFLNEMLHFLKGFTFFFWATATWWIPMLIILGVWRHIYKRFPITYNPLFWGAVFPIGMYTVCTYKLGEVTGLPITIISNTFIYVALSVWGITFYGLLKKIVKSVYFSYQITKNLKKSS